MATTKKLDPFGGGTAINSGTVQTGGGRIYTAGEPQYRTVTARNVPLVYATEPAKPMVERWGSPEWKAAHGTAGATQIQAAQTPLNQAAQTSFTPQTSSFGESGSMTATNAANANTAYPSYVGASFTNTQPIDYQPPEKPTYTEPYDVPGMRQAYMDAVNQGFSYDKRPDYDMYYGSQYDSMINDLTNRQAFSYDPNTDPVYQAYKKQYAREGQRATQDTMASAAGMTGGVPSSYAVSAAQQAGNYYASQMSDKLPELYNQAYNRYLQEYQNQISALSAVNNAERLRHDVWLGNIDNYWKGVGMDYDIHRDAVNDAYNALNAERNISNDAYGRYIDELNQYNTDNKFGYGQTIDQMNYEQGNENTAYQRAEAEEEQARLRQQEELERAITLAELGDMSALQALGVDTSYYETLQQAKLADQQAQTTARLMRGSGSSGSSGKSVGGSAAGGEPLSLGGENGGIDEASLNRITEIGDKAGENGGIVESEDDWNFLLQYFTERQLNEEYGLYPQSEAEDLQAAAEAQYMADLINQQYEGQLTPNQSANRALNKARHNNGAVTNPKDWKTLTDTYSSGDLNKTGYYFTGSSTAGLSGGDEARNAVLNGTVAPVSGDQAAALAAQKALSGTSDIAYGKSSAARNGTVRTATGVSSEASASTSKPKVNTTGTPTFNTAADAKKYAQSHGVKMVDMKYYTEPEFLKYKMNNSDGSLKFYNSYRDYLSGYTSYLINKYGK